MTSAELRRQRAATGFRVSTSLLPAGSHWESMNTSSTITSLPARAKAARAARIRSSLLPYRKPGTIVPSFYLRKPSTLRARLYPSPIDSVCERFDAEANPGLVRESLHRASHGRLPRARRSMERNDFFLASLDPKGRPHTGQRLVPERVNVSRATTGAVIDLAASELVHSVPPRDRPAHHVVAIGRGPGSTSCMPGRFLERFIWRPDLGDFLRELCAFSRLIVFDSRGPGLRPTALRRLTPWRSR